MTTGLFSGTFEYGLTVTSQPDGKILTVGYYQGPPNPQDTSMIVVRYNSSGTLDTSFAGIGNGILTINQTAGADVARSLALQSDGKIVIGGSTDFTQSNGTTDNFALSRLLANGIPDSTFGTSSSLIVDFAGDRDELNDIVIQPDGDIVGVGQTYNGNNNDVALIRVNGDNDAPTQRHKYY